MQWKDVITFTENNTVFRFRVFTEHLPNGHQYKINVEELDEHDKSTGSFSFLYDAEQEMPMSDAALHNKPITTLLTEMLREKPDVHSWN